MRLLALLFAAAPFAFADSKTDCMVQRDFYGNVRSVQCDERTSPSWYDIAESIRARKAQRLDVESKELDIEMKRIELERMKRAEEDEKNAKSSKVVAAWIAAAKAKKAAKEREAAEDELAAKSKKVWEEEKREEWDKEASE